MRSMDLSSWHGILTSLLGLALFALIGVGIRVLLTLTIQQRRERANRQINERLKTLMAAYRTLGGSFTGNLSVDPTHLGELRRRWERSRDRDGNSGSEDAVSRGFAPQDSLSAPLIPAEAFENGKGAGSERARRIRDSVEAALSDILLLGTEQQVRLAAKAVSEMVEGRPIHTAELVVSLRDFIRKALDLDPVPADLRIPFQGPTRPSGNGGGRSSGGDKDSGNGRGGGRTSAVFSGGGEGGMGTGMRQEEHPVEEEPREAGH